MDRKVYVRIIICLLLLVGVCTHMAVAQGSLPNPKVGEAWDIQAKQLLIGEELCNDRICVSWFPDPNTPGWYFVLITDSRDGAYYGTDHHRCIQDVRTDMVSILLYY